MKFYTICFKYTAPPSDYFIEIMMDFYLDFHPNLSDEILFHGTEFEIEKIWFTPMDRDVYIQCSAVSDFDYSNREESMAISLINTYSEVKEYCKEYCHDNFILNDYNLGCYDDLLKK